MNTETETKEVERLRDQIIPLLRDANRHRSLSSEAILGALFSAAIIPMAALNTIERVLVISTLVNEAMAAAEPFRADMLKHGLLKAVHEENPGKLQ